MTKYIIRWDIGYGCSYKIVEADDEDEAQDLAYEQWREDAENSADYGILEYNEENCADYDLEWEE